MSLVSSPSSVLPQSSCFNAAGRVFAAILCYRKLMKSFFLFLIFFPSFWIFGDFQISRCWMDTDIGFVFLIFTINAPYPILLELLSSQLGLFHKALITSSRWQLCVVSFLNSKNPLGWRLFPHLITRFQGFAPRKRLWSSPRHTWYEDEWKNFFFH